LGAVGAADQVLEVGWQVKASVQYAVVLACLQPVVSQSCLVTFPCVGYSAFVAHQLLYSALLDDPAEDFASFAHSQLQKQRLVAFAAVAVAVAAQSDSGCVGAAVLDCEGHLSGRVADALERSS